MLLAAPGFSLPAPRHSAEAVLQIRRIKTIGEGSR